MASRPPIPKAVKAAVVARDGWRCVLCGWTPGQPITQRPKKRSGYKRPPAWGLEYDHIHPWSKGGKHTVDNLRILCTGCNSRKGARVACAS